jgi:hypothetical protein
MSFSFNDIKSHKFSPNGITLLTTTVKQNSFTSSAAGGEVLPGLGFRVQKISCTFQVF